MMKLLIGIVAAGILAAGFWIAMNSGDAPAPEADPQAMNQDMQAPTGERGRGTFASLFGMSGSFRCTISSENPEGTADGVVYVKDGNVRGEFNTVSQAGAMTAYMIKDGDVVYSWSSAMPMGIKAAASAMESDDDAPMQDSQVFDANTSVDYSCEPATVDAAIFVPPSDIQFMDMSAGMPDVESMMKMQMSQ